MTTQTILQYNGIRLQNVQTLHFIETPVNDDAGNYQYTKTSLKVLGYFTTTNHKTIGVFPQLSEYPGNGLDQGASQQFGALRKYLEQPRRRLIYSTLATGSVLEQAVNGNDPALDPAIGDPVFIIEPPRSTYTDANDNLRTINTRHDVHGGPFPKEVNVTHVTNNHVWRVEFTVEFATAAQCHVNPTYFAAERIYGESLNPEDPAEEQVAHALENVEFESTQRQLGILGHRWSCTDRIDENGYTTRTYNGSLTLSNPNWNPHDFRAITVPPVVPGMQRKSFDYVSSEDGLTIRYTVTDEEVTITAPWPARTIKIMHNEADYDGGATVKFTVRVALTTDRKTNLYQLMLLASAIIDQRLFLGQVIDPNVRASVFVQRYEYTTEQGSDQNHAVTLICSGERHPLQQENPIAERAIVMSRSLSWRPVRDAANVPLSNYNNVLSRGNRPGEQPDTEGGIPAISILHNLLTTPCTQEFGTPSSVPDSTTVTERIRRIDDIESSESNYDTEGMYQAYPDAITVEINDNLANSDISTTYSNQHKTFMYSHYNITSSYGNKALKVPLPVAKTYGYTLQSNVVVGIGPSQPTRIIRIEAERAGAPPRLPNPIESFEETGNYVPGGDTPTVTNTLINVTTKHLNPAPVADGQTLIYTSYIDIEYSQNAMPAKHKFCIPDYIEPTESGSPDSLTDKTKYSFALSSIFVPGALETTWNT
jgi:hypothetical protein